MIKSYKSLLISFICLLLFNGVAYGFHIPFLQGICFWAIFIYMLVLCNKNSILQKTTIDNMGIKGWVIIGITCALLIALCVLPMDLSPTWNGRNPMHRNQYEVMAQSILNGHLYMDYEDVDPKLLTMENPYDWQQRIEQEVIYHWDHAFYDGHYYMYFGVVPVFLLFIPFQLIFGRPLVTFHATQFFVMFAIVAFFALFYILAKKYFSKLPLATYLISSIALILMSIGYCVQAPALYCTAISSAICFMLWSLLFYCLAVLVVKKEKWSIVLAVLGALCGALAFGCRPPVALANLVAIPLACTYAKNYKGKHIVRNFCMIAIPYLIVAGLLMTYNYVRFEDAFEFGQAYQLTSSDQTSYGSFFERFRFMKEVEAIFYNFLHVGEFTEAFPYINYGGFLVAYPLMWLFVPYFSHDSVREAIKKDKMGWFIGFLLGTAFFITLVDMHWAPGLCERYRLDCWFLMAILMFLLIGYRLKTAPEPLKCTRWISVFSVVSILAAFLLFMRPLDGNFAEVLPEQAEVVRKTIMFWELW